jgi:hypothetical protein
VKSLVILVLVLFELVLTLFFLVGILTERIDDLFLGTILGLEFIVLAFVMIFYILTMPPPREVVEDRDEGLLW